MGTITIVDWMQNKFIGGRCYYIVCDHPCCDAVMDRKPIEMDPNHGGWREVPELMDYARSQGWFVEERTIPSKNRFLTYCPLHRSA